jgi:large subunit ribosomal protein L19
MNNDIAALLLKKYGKQNPPAVKAGDTIRVYQKIREGDKERVQVFEGLVIAVKHGRGLNGSYTVRKIAAGGIGVERVYPLHSPNVVKVERVKSARVHRAKLYYMRDRLGKAARFKSESQSKETWDESAVVAEIAAAEAAAETAPEEEEVEVLLENPEAEVVEETEATSEEIEDVKEEAAEEEAEEAAEEEKTEEKEESAK